MSYLQNFVSINLREGVDFALKEAETKLFIASDLGNKQETKTIADKAFDFYGMTIRLNMSEKLRFFERAMIKSKDNEIK